MSVEPGRRGRGRPRVSTREDVELAAVALMRRDGYENVTVASIVSAAGISRTTFFRYFGSKPGVIWYAFDTTIERLAAAIAAAPADADTLDAVRAAVVESTRAAVQDSPVWLERFQLLDTVAELQAESHQHWEQWKRAIAEHIAARLGSAPDSVIPLAVAGAFHGGFVAQLRVWRDDRDRDAFIAHLDRNMEHVAALLRPLPSTDLG
ncbi:TetR family transcriptional regulator [Streptomyces shenzhenensis]|uniref:acyl-CoA-like ligand-binding transcription factor n=1 Tax=Streptomyces shenzhenensis TaxID=943815 RepID=UPI001C82787E|nr:TetR family transcriptional regulator [Streptomyces shenzhenensis]